MIDRRNGVDGKTCNRPTTTIGRVLLRKVESIVAVKECHKTEAAKRRAISRESKAVTGSD